VRLTKHILEGMYYALRCAEPFSTFRLPHPSTVTFKVNRASMAFGDYEPDPHTIRISRECNKNLDSVFKTMAHEMVHLALERKGAKDHSNHDAEFNALGAKVCNAWGWNFKEF